jgi:hypothetical protein
MVLVLELVYPPSPTLYRSGLDGSGPGTGGFSFSVLGLVWMVLVMELVDFHTMC